MPADLGGGRTAITDVLGQAVGAILGRRLRSAFTAAGIGLGVAATVATVGISSSAAGAISDRFDAVAATTVTARYRDAAVRPDPATVHRLHQVNGVVDAGVSCATGQDSRLAATAADIADGGGERVDVLAAQPGALRAAGVELLAGRMFDDGHDERGDRVAIIDSVAARALRISDPGRSPLIYVDDQRYALIGVYQAPVGQPQFTNAVVLPYAACRHGWAEFTESTVTARTDLGAADQVGGAMPLVLAPEDGSAVEVLIPADLRSFRQGVEQETQALFLGLAAVSLIIGALGVSNTMLISVLERRTEIGLRRAVGAGRPAVAGQFLVESALVGLAGGAAGTVIGIDVTSAVCLLQGWLVVLDPTVVFAGPLVGLAVGAVAGVYPAYAATRVLPAATLRG